MVKLNSPKGNQKMWSYLLQSSDRGVSSPSNVFFIKCFDIFGVQRM